MKIVFSDDVITVYTQIEDDTNIDDFVKNLILKLKRKYRTKISGFYQINIYKNSRVGAIVDIFREDDDCYFNDLIDFKINVFENSDVYISFNDYFFNDRKDVFIINNKYYINVNSLSDSDFLLATEFGEYEYGDKISDVFDKRRVIL